MNKFQFSLSKLQRFQKQKLRLTEIEMLNAKAVLDESVAELDKLILRFDQIASSCNESLGSRWNLTHAHRDTIEHLQREIEKALVLIKENELAWRKMTELGSAERIKTESYELLRKSEKVEHDAEIEKSENSELSDTVMRKWSDSNGEINDD